MKLIRWLLVTFTNICPKHFRDYENYVTWLDDLGCHMEAECSKCRAERILRQP